MNPLICKKHHYQRFFNNELLKKEIQKSQTDKKLVHTNIIFCEISVKKRFITVIKDIKLDIFLSE